MIDRDNGRRNRFHDGLLFQLMGAHVVHAVIQSTGHTIECIGKFVVISESGGLDPISKIATTKAPGGIDGPSHHVPLDAIGGQHNDDTQDKQGREHHQDLCCGEVLL